MEILIILGISLALAASSGLFNKFKTLGLVNVCGQSLILLTALWLGFKLINLGAPIKEFNIFYIDALSGFFIIVISVINFAASIYSLGYIACDVKEGAMSARKSKTYFILFNLFSFTMFLVTVVNNLGFVWVAIEMTTLVSAFFVGFYNYKTSIEAAWKYIIICSVGITLALLGTILFYYTASLSGGIRSLNWSDMLSVAKKLDPRILKIAFLFILVGYGTKAGLAPMHTWLPDAHSQAPSPISALLSGVLLKTAVYAILRFTVIINKCIGSQYSGNLLILFGLLSLAVSAGFILAQKDLKRLLAYSSVEHMGIISLGLGFGGTIGVFGALLHIFNHAVTKSFMFFGAGNVVKHYKTSNLNMIRGVKNAMPFCGVMLILGAFALAGSVPFSIFISEIIILVAGFSKGYYVSSILFIVFITVIFAALIHHFSGILFGRKPENIGVRREPLSAKFAFIFLFIFIFTLGFFIPGPLNKLLVLAVGVVNGA